MNAKKRVTRQSILDTLVLNAKRRVPKKTISMLKKFMQFEANTKIRLFTSFRANKQRRLCNNFSHHLLSKFIDTKIENDDPFCEHGKYIILSTKDINLLRKRVNYFIENEEKRWKQR